MIALVGTYWLAQSTNSYQAKQARATISYNANTNTSRTNKQKLSRTIPRSHSAKEKGSACYRAVNIYSRY